MTKKTSKPPNATCGWCNAPLCVTVPYNRKKHTAYCSPEHMIVDYLFRTLYADEPGDKFDLTSWKEKDDEE